jgi:transcriptional regulator with XRE-family HTH domain
MDQQQRRQLVIRINVVRLARECAVRGWSYHELARRAHVSRPTVSAAVRGRPIRPHSYHQIARALADEAPLDGGLDLLGDQT